MRPKTRNCWVLMTKRISLDKEIVTALKEGDISEFAVALGYDKDADTLDFVLKKAKIDYE